MELRACQRKEGGEKVGKCLDDLTTLSQKTAEELEVPF